MSIADRVRGRAVVVQPDEGPSYWQPVPVERALGMNDTRAE